MMEAPDSLCVVLIRSQAQLKGLPCAITGAAEPCQVLVSSRSGGVAVVEPVIHFWTTGGPGYINLLAWFLSDFTGFVSTSCVSPGHLLRLVRGVIIVPCAFPSHS